MMPWWRFLLRPWLPQIDRLQSLPPIPDPAPGPEYHMAMAQAEAARRRAEEIIADLTGTKPPKRTRPA